MSPRTAGRREAKTTENEIQDALGFKVKSLCNIEEEEIEWVWKPYVPVGKITIVQGDPGEGKTTFCLALAARLSREGVRTMYLTAEDGYGDTIVPRLRREEADLRCISTVLTDPRAPLSFTDTRLREAIRMTLPKLVILDPVQAFLGEDVDMNSANKIRPVMAYLGKLAEEEKCAVMLIGHMNKAVQTRDIYRGLGSIDLPAAARSVILVRKSKDNPRQRIVSHIKSSLAENARDAIWEFDEAGRLRFVSYADNATGAQTATTEARTRLELFSYLKEKRRTLDELRAWAEAKGITQTTLERARRALHVNKTVKIDGVRYVQLDLHEEEEEKQPEPESTAQ